MIANLWDPDDIPYLFDVPDHTVVAMDPALVCHELLRWKLLCVGKC